MAKSKQLPPILKNFREAPKLQFKDKEVEKIED